MFPAKVLGEGRVLTSAEPRVRLVPDGDDFRLRDRYVELDGVVLASENLSVIF